MKFTQNLRAFALLSAGVFASFAYAATVSQEVWAGPEPVVTGKALSRAEVQADWLLWKQAGLDVYSQGDGAHFDQSSYDAKLAHYLQLRNSPAFAELVERIQASTK